MTGRVDVAIQPREYNSHCQRRYPVDWKSGTLRKVLPMQARCIKTPPWCNKNLENRRKPMAKTRPRKGKNGQIAEFPGPQSAPEGSDTAVAVEDPPEP